MLNYRISYILIVLLSLSCNVIAEKHSDSKKACGCATSTKSYSPSKKMLMGAKQPYYDLINTLKNVGFSQSDAIQISNQWYKVWVNSPRSANISSAGVIPQYRKDMSLQERREELKVALEQTQSKNKMTEKEITQACNALE